MNEKKKIQMDARWTPKRMPKENTDADTSMQAGMTHALQKTATAMTQKEESKKHGGGQARAPLDRRETEITTKTKKKDA